MTSEVAKAINNISKRLNEVERKLDEYFNQKIQETQDTMGDAWNPNKMYEPDEICINNNTVYKCIVRNKGIVPTDLNFFEPKTLVDILKEEKEKEDK